MRQARSGHTLLELVVTGVILLLLMAALMGVYAVGTRSWAQTESQGHLLSDLQVASVSLTQELERSAYDGLTVNDDALSVLSAADSEGRLELDLASGAIHWQRYLIFYFDSQAQALRRLALSLDSAAPQRTVPAPLETWSGPQGARPLLDYRTGGTVIARGVTGVFFEIPAQTRLVRISLEAERRAYGKQTPYTVSLRTAARIRN